MRYGTSPVAARMAVRRGGRAAESLGDGGVAKEVPPLNTQLAAYFERGAGLLAAASSSRSSIPRRVAIRISTAIGEASTVCPRAMAMGLPSMAAGSNGRSDPSSSTASG